MQTLNNHVASRGCTLTASHAQFALQQHRRGDLRAAEASYRHILTENADDADAMQYLGVLCIQTSRASEAINLIRRAVELQPGAADWHCNLGEAYRLTGDPVCAIDAYREAIRLKPTLAVAHNNMGIALSDLCEMHAAIEAYETALRINPDYADAWANLGGMLKSGNRAAEAVVACERALAIDPRHAPALNNLGVALAYLGRWSDATTAYHRALSIDPNYADVLGNLCNALCAMGDPSAGVRAGERAIELLPASHQLQHNLATALLQAGELRRGFAAYESRWRRHPDTPAARFGIPSWDGSDIAGKTILLHAEQGFGDAIHFARYAPLVAQRGARVILQCQPELAELFQSLAGVERVILPMEPLSRYHAQCSLMSLPLAFGTERDSIPANVPYLRVKAERLETSDDPASARPLRVGLSWAGNNLHHNDRYRSIALGQLEPLLHVPGRIEWYAIQKGPPIAQALQPPFDHRFIDLGETTRSFTDTAARLGALDLLITVDTAVAHLAGALGRPVWTLIAKPCDWRWMNDPDRSPWYPTMRLFRQTTPGDWSDVVPRVAAALTELAKEFGA